MSTWFAAWLLASSLARAQSYYLESDPIAMRDVADALSSTSGGASCPGSVVRRYVQGEGWRFLFRSASVPDVAQARGCIAALQMPAGVTVRLMEQVDDRRRVVGVWPSEGATGEPPAQPVDPRLAKIPTDAAEIIARIERTHAGATGGAGEAPTLLFRFERLTPDGTKVRHVYVRRGDDRYLAVDVLAGTGVSSRAGVVGSTAWLSGSTKKLDPAVARSQIDRFAPASVLEIAADLARGKIGLPEASDMRVESSRMVEGHSVVQLGVDGSRDRLATKLLIDADTWRLLAVEHGTTGAAVRWTFQGWREVEDGSLRPERILVTRGSEILDTVDVRDLELSPTLPPEWFVPPAR